MNKYNHFDTFPTGEDSSASIDLEIDKVNDDDFKMISLKKREGGQFQYAINVENKFSFFYNLGEFIRKHKYKFIPISLTLICGTIIIILTIILSSDKKNTIFVEKPIPELETFSTTVSPSYMTYLNISNTIEKSFTPTYYETISFQYTNTPTLIDTKTISVKPTNTETKSNTPMFMDTETVQPKPTNTETKTYTPTRTPTKTRVVLVPIRPPRF